MLAPLDEWLELLLANEEGCCIAVIGGGYDCFVISIFAKVCWLLQMDCYNVLFVFISWQISSSNIASLSSADGSPVSTVILG